MNTLQKPRFSVFLVCCLFLAGLTARLSAADTYFSVAQYTNPGYPIWAIGDPTLDNPSGGSGTAVYPAYSLDMPFSNGSTCAFQCFADTSVAKGNYYVGYYSGGDAYLYVY